ncbi:MAG: two-component sensor histidine kinase, partial [Actinomycetota bacterium]|nr:two-component sensor histidine kinase [Actinomycetota bacterium]
MRRRLVLVFVAVSTLVATAFVIPLGFLVRRTAEDRSIDAARADAAAVVPTLAGGGTEAQIEAGVGVTVAGRE